MIFRSVRGMLAWLRWPGASPDGGGSTHATHLEGLHILTFLACVFFLSISGILTSPTMDAPEGTFRLRTAWS